jgi:hypothetical protein
MEGSDMRTTKEETPMQVKRMKKKQRKKDSEQK